MSGLVNGLQNRLRRFESARHLTKKFGNLDKQRVSDFLFCQDWKICDAFVTHNKMTQEDIFNENLDIYPENLDKYALFPGNEFVGSKRSVSR